MSVIRDRILNLRGWGSRSGREGIWGEVAFSRFLGMIIGWPDDS